MPLRTVLAVLLLVTALPVLARPVTPPPEVVALRTEIAALELDRALALTPEQARALLPLLQQGAAEAKAFRARIETADPALVAALTRARDELRAGGPVSASTRDAVVAARRAEFGAARAGFQVLRKQAMAILTPAQVEALRTVRLGVGPQPPEGAPVGDRAHGPGRRLIMAGVLTSDAFLGLVQGRAR
jgi:hypothetical protein